MPSDPDTIERLIQLSTELREVRKALGIIERNANELTNPPQIPWDTWYVKPDDTYNNVTRIFCNGAPLLDVMKSDDFPDLVNVLTQSNRLYHCLREFVALFQSFGKHQQTNELSAVFWLNGRPIEPTRCRDFVEAIQLLQKCKPGSPPSSTPLPEHTPTEEVRYDLGPVELKDKQPAQLRLWQLQSTGHYLMGMKQPRDPETDEVYQFVGLVTLPESDPNDTAF